MRRRCGVTIGQLLLLGLSACAAPDGPDSETVQEWQDWMDERHHGQGVDVVATFSGLPSTDVPLGEAGEEGVSSTFDVPRSVTAMEFSCIGAEKMGVDVTLSSERGATTRRTEDLACADSPHLLDETLDAATGVRARGFAASGLGAWAVVVRTGS